MPFSAADKVVHCALFAVGAAFLSYALRRSVSWPSGFLFLAVVILMTACGILDEIHQLYTPGRSGGDIGDITADAVGAAFGAAASLLIHGRYRRKPHLPAPGGTPAA